MDVRDAVEADAEGMATIADSPTDAMRNLIHDRSVRIAVEPATDDGGAGTVADDESDAGSDDDGTGDAGPAPDDDGDAVADSDDAEESMLGFVSFDARPDAVHVTQLDGTLDACSRLLEEPLAFARGEGMPVEVLVPDDDGTVRDAVESAGFDEDGTGPRFEGQPTVRYRYER